MFLKLINPTVVLHAKNGIAIEDRPSNYPDVVFLAWSEIAVVRLDEEKKTYSLYLKDHHRFICLVSNPDQWLFLTEKLNGHR